MDEFLSTEIAAGTTVGDILSVQFLVGIGANLLTAIIILIAAFLVSSFVKRRIEGLAMRYKRLDDTLFSFLANIAKYVILTFAFIFVLNRFGVQTASLVALVGAAGLAIGLALQGVLSGVAAGVMLVMFRPIKKGDFIIVSGVMGTVKDISIFTTEIATLDNVQVTMPNSDIWGQPITNYSVYDTRRAEWTFGVSYDSNLATAEQVIRDTIMADPRSRTEPAPFIQVNNLNDSSVDFLVRVWVAASDYFQFQADMKRKVKEALDDNGVGIPFPTRTLVYDGGVASSPATDAPTANTASTNGAQA